MHGAHRDKDALARAQSDFPRPPSRNTKGKAPAAANTSSKKIITYVLNESRLANTSPPHLLQEAIDFAYEVFPAELADVPREQIQLTVGVRVKDQPARVVVSRSAWTTIAAELKQYEIVHVNVLDKPVPRSPRPRSNNPMEDAYTSRDSSPPSYTPPDPAHQQQQYLSPDEKATSSSSSHSRSPSPSLGDRFKGWLKGDSE
ncbi:hypothetical protein BC835DRAFT_1416284 [Cytidiella melzeri]|nr:hypothetical protein BC835DRAFT_1416284 [Cytidiella melzeri]